MQTFDLFRRIGIKNFRDQAYLKKVVDLFEHSNECSNFTLKTTDKLDREYSSIRKRLKKIIENGSEDAIREELNITDEKRITSKLFVKKILIKVKDEE